MIPALRRHGDLPARSRIEAVDELPSRALPYVLLGLGLFGVGLAAWRPIPAGVWHDDGVYMLVGKGQLHRASLDQLEAACPGTVFVLAQMPTSMVVSLNWDSDCGDETPR